MEQIKDAVENGEWGAGTLGSSLERQDETREVTMEGEFEVFNSRGS